jgi:hypothetical protein
MEKFEIMQIQKLINHLLIYIALQSKFKRKRRK